jgi:hypothetical protein
MKSLDGRASGGLEKLLITQWVGLGVGLIATVLIAYWLANQQLTNLALLLGVAVVVVVASVLRERSWVLIPLGWMLTGTSQFIPMNLSYQNVCFLLAFSAYVTYIIVTHQKLWYRWGPLDYVLAINLAWIAVAILRHPVGFLFVRSERVGGRPLVEIALALSAYWVLVRLPSSLKLVARIPYFILAGATLVALLNLVVYLAPATTPYLYRFYKGVETSLYLNLGGVTQEGITRWGALMPFGMIMIFILCGLYPPRTLFNPLRPRFYLFALGLAAILASGFRSGLLWVFIALALGSWLHRGWREVVLCGIAGTLVLGPLLVGQGRLYRLPLPAQRALAWLPGQWSPVVVEATDLRREGRFDWWRKIIKNNLIHDWWLGDGFGMTRSDLEISFFNNADFETASNATGGFHNGPLTSIRFVGIVGMVCFYVYMIAAAVSAVQCMHRCRGTPLQVVAVFLAIQLVWEPFHFTLVFGAYESQVPQTIFLVAILQLVTRMAENLNLQAANGAGNSERGATTGTMATVVAR